MKVAIFLTWDYSLKSWENTGTINRELELFHKLNKEYNIEFSFFTYGDQKDYKYIDEFDYLKIYPIYEKIKYSKSRFIRLVKSFLIPIKMRKELENIDLIYQNQLLGSWVSILAKFKTKKPLVIRTGYDMLEFAIKEGKTSFLIFFYKILKKISIKYCDQFTVTSITDYETTKKDYVKYENKIKLRPNWVNSENISSFKNRSGDKILAIGRLVKQKNFNFLISEFKNTKDSITIDIVGSGHEKYSLKKLASEKNVSVNFLGNFHHSDLLKLYKEYKFFISTSYFEGNPKTVLEAMGAGCVVLASDIPNHRELISNKVDGILFKLSENDLLNSFNKLINDELDVLSISKKASQKIKDQNSLNSLAKNTYLDFKDLKTIDS